MQKRITLSVLLRLEPTQVDFATLGHAVKETTAIRTTG
jgi:hypothetical protein